MAIRSFDGQTMGLVTLLSFLFWAVVTKVTAGQELILTRQFDNLKPAEIRLDSRAIRWMDFTKPERQPQQQVGPQKKPNGTTNWAELETKPTLWSLAGQI